MARRRNNNSTPKKVVVRATEPEAMSLAGWVNVAPRRDVVVHLQELDDEKRAEVWNAILRSRESGALEVRLVDGKQPKKKLGTPKEIEHVAGKDKLEKAAPENRDTNLTGEGKTDGPVKPDSLKKPKKTKTKKAVEEANEEKKAEAGADAKADAKADDKTEDKVEEKTKTSNPPAPPTPPTPPATPDEEASGDSAPELNDL